MERTGKSKEHKKWYQLKPSQVIWWICVLPRVVWKERGMIRGAGCQKNKKKQKKREFFFFGIAI